MPLYKRFSCRVKSQKWHSLQHGIMAILLQTNDSVCSWFLYKNNDWIVFFFSVLQWNLYSNEQISISHSIEIIILSQNKTGNPASVCQTPWWEHFNGEHECSPIMCEYLYQQNVNNRILTLALSLIGETLLLHVKVHRRLTFVRFI